MGQDYVRCTRPWVVQQGVDSTAQSTYAHTTIQYEVLVQLVTAADVSSRPHYTRCSCAHLGTLAFRHPEIP